MNVVFLVSFIVVGVSWLSAAVVGGSWGEFAVGCGWLGTISLETVVLEKLRNLMSLSSSSVKWVKTEMEEIITANSKTDFGYSFQPNTITESLLSKENRSYFGDFNLNK